MKNKRILIVVGMLLLIGSAVLFWPLVAAFFASDDCVSSGGSYDYSARLCDFSENHPFVPFYRTWSFWLAAGVGAVGCWVLGRGADSTAA